MLTRRTLVTTLAALPLCGLIRPKKQVDDLGGFLVPSEFASAIESHQGVFFGERVTFSTPTSKEECCRLRGVPYDQHAEKADAQLTKMITNAMRERS
jgi:hypothetical protein